MTRDEIRELVCHEIDCILDSDWMDERLHDVLKQYHVLHKDTVLKEYLRKHLLKDITNDKDSN